VDASEFNDAVPVGAKVRIKFDNGAWGDSVIEKPAFESDFGITVVKVVDISEPMPTKDIYPLDQGYNAEL